MPFLIKNSSLAQGKGRVLWLFVKKSCFLVGGFCKRRCANARGFPGVTPCHLGVTADKSIMALVKESCFGHKSAILNAGVGASADSGSLTQLHPYVRLSSSPRFHQRRWRKGLFF